MSAANTASIIRAFGTLIWNPTDLGAAEPYGGTYLGQVRGIVFKPQPQYRDIWAEEFGSVTDSIYVGEGPCEIRATLRYPDVDMVNVVAPKSIQPGSSGIHWLFRPGGTTSNTRAGTSLYDSKSGKLLFAPYATNAHPMILMYKALPQIATDGEIPFSIKDEWGLPVRFVGAPDSNGRVYDTGRKATLVL